MTEYEELRAEINRYQMKRFKYHKSLLQLNIMAIPRR